MTTRKREPTYDDGPPAAERFDAAMQRLVKVSKEELAKREATYKEQKHQKTKRRP